MNMPRIFFSVAVLTCLPFCGLNAAGEQPWTEIPKGQWKGTLAADVPSLKRTAAAVVALPAKEAKPLLIQVPDAQSCGQYEFRLTILPSHTADGIAYNTVLKAKMDDAVAAEFPGQFFTRTHQPEVRIVKAVKRKAGPLSLALEANGDEKITEETRTAANLKSGGPKIGKDTENLGEGKDSELDMELDLALSPDKAVYYIVDKAEFRLLSCAGVVTKIEVDKIRYTPGDTLKGTAEVADLGGKGGTGSLNIYFEHGVKDRVKAKSLPVTLKPEPQTVSFDVPVPKEELGYALVAEYASADGADRSEASAYFGIADNFQRIAIFGGGLATRDAILDDETIRKGLKKARSEFFNATEYFAWAEDDMVGMSPKTDFWSSGQTNYRQHKQTMQRQLQLAHEQGFAVSTYGKFIMSGFMGWERAYDYPGDHRGNYFYPVGMWEGVNVSDLDRRRDQDFRVYGKGPNVPGNPFNTWWSTFLPINPDATPFNVRIAAEECARSAEMFGWDAIRWDGHPRGGGQCGASGDYQAWAARKTQSLVRYFKEVIAEKCPRFRHGYNYLLIEPTKGYDWAVEDFELDELCRGGGLLMNESIGNASAGWTFAQIAQNLQVEGDLCRERGGYYLGISYAMTPRDMIIESALWASAGCRPYNDAMTLETRRYCTRYSQYCFDENLRRIATPEKVLAPQSETKVWWQPFVYETPTVAGKRQLVVNLLNLPLQEKRPNNRDDKPKPVWDMPPGTEPVSFAISLPAGLRATSAALIDPHTLVTTDIPLKDNKFQAPPVSAWSVVVINLAVEEGAPSLGALFGPPKTLGVKRSGVKESDRKAEIVLDPKIEIWEVNKKVSDLVPDWQIKLAKDFQAIDALSGKARDEKLLARRQPVEALEKEWWKGAAIPDDLKLKDKKFNFGDLSPRRDGRFDIFYGRGAMDYRLKMPLSFARLDKFKIHDAPLWGACRQSPGMGLGGNVNWQRYPEFDILLFTGIPHCAIGVENCYGLAEYVKAGGAAFFTGGEYAFGKGGYMYTVLERELLPLLCTGMVDTVYPDKPQPFEPGPDFAELKTELDFAAKPSFWVRNEVVLKPGTKIFLKSGERPILVGWQLGKGRVACLLVDYRGKTENGVTAFFDWKDWPKLAEAVMLWLSPDALKNVPPVAADAKTILKDLDSQGDDAALEDLEKADGGADLKLPDAGTATGAAELKGEALKKRLALIDRAFLAGGPEIAAALTGQLASVSNIPLDKRMKIVSILHRERPAKAAANGRSAVASKDGIIQANGYILLALAGDPEFVKLAVKPPDLPGETADAKLERLRDLSLAVALYPRPDLVEEGKRRVEAWNKQEADIRAKFAKQILPDSAMLETNPYIDAESTFARIAWLAYLSRHEPKAYLDQFIHEWLRSALYQDYCGRSLGNLQELKTIGKAKLAAATASWTSLSERFAALREMTQPDVEALISKSPAESGAAMAKIRFTPDFRTVLNLMGSIGRKEAQSVVTPLAASTNRDLAEFANARKTDVK